MPAGLELRAEKSAPGAPKAPPVAMLLAVPPKVRYENRNASTSYWAFTLPAKPRLNNKLINMTAFFIVMFFLVNKKASLVIIVHVTHGCF